MRKSNFIINMRLKIIGETESVIEINSFAGTIVVKKESVITLYIFWRCDFIFISRDLILDITYIIPASKPFGAISLIFVFGPDTWFHSNLIQTGCFRKIQDVKLNSVRPLVLR